MPRLELPGMLEYPYLGTVSCPYLLSLGLQSIVLYPVPMGALSRESSNAVWACNGYKLVCKHIQAQFSFENLYHTAWKYQAGFLSTERDEGYDSVIDIILLPMGSIEAYQLVWHLGLWPRMPKLADTPQSRLFNSL